MPSDSLLINLVLLYSALCQLVVFVFSSFFLISIPLFSIFVSGQTQTRIKKADWAIGTELLKLSFNF